MLRNCKRYLHNKRYTPLSFITIRSTVIRKVYLTNKDVSIIQMDIDLLSLVILLVLGFIASFLNAIVGGGGLISLPALLAVGLPPSTAIATNKLANTISNGTSMLTFYELAKLM